MSRRPARVAEEPGDSAGHAGFEISDVLRLRSAFGPSHTSVATTDTPPAIPLGSCDARRSSPASINSAAEHLATALSERQVTEQQSGREARPARVPCRADLIGAVATQLRR
jgi:hypothetical protein